MDQGSARYLQVLGLEPGATRDQIKEAYRDLSKVWHPDRFAHDPKMQGKAQERLKTINEAYERLQSYEPPAPSESMRRPNQPPSSRAGPRILHRSSVAVPAERLWVAAVAAVVVIVIVLFLTAL